MSTYDYEVAVQVLSDVEKNRFLACYLNSTDTNAVSQSSPPIVVCPSMLTCRSQVDWQKAADDFGSASIGSFKKMIQNAFKKVKDAQEKVANGEEVAAPAPASAKAKGGKKRKAADEGGDDSEETPKPKAKRGKQPKKATPEDDGKY